MLKRSEVLVPIFKLYGETTAWPTPDLIHCESIPERSRLHGWEIKPHRHGDLVQLLFIQAGCAELDVEGSIHKVTLPTLLLVPALSVHGFRFSQDTQGYVLSLAQPLVEQMSLGLGSQLMKRSVCYALNDGVDELHGMFEDIAEEYALHAAGRDLRLQALITLLLVALHRRWLGMAKPQSLERDRGQEHVDAFTTLLEAQLRQHWPIARYARSLGIGAAHLNALCRRLRGQSALQIINQRLVLEAKRCLVYTNMNVNQVSDSLGFSEPAYFSRFFKRETGIAPKVFRVQR